MGETRTPISFHRLDIPFLLLCCPKPLSKHDTKSDGETPLLACDLTEQARVLARSSRASASATCSLGFRTGKPYIGKQIYIVPSTNTNSQRQQQFYDQPISITSNIRENILLLRLRFAPIEISKKSNLVVIYIWRRFWRAYGEFDS